MALDYETNELTAAQLPNPPNRQQKIIISKISHLKVYIIKKPISLKNSAFYRTRTYNL